LERYLKPFLTENEEFGYEVDMKDGWSQKLGFVAKKKNAVAVFEVNNITRNRSIYHG